MVNLKDKKGIALVMSLFVTVLLVSLSTMFVLRTIRESKLTAIERSSSKAFYAAHGGSQAALVQLNTLINNYLLNTIANSNPNTLAAYTNQMQQAAGGSVDWLLNSVRLNNVPVLLDAGDQAEYPGSGNMGEYSYDYNIIITEKTAPIEVEPNEKWDFFYNFRIESGATEQDMSKQVVISGDFTVRVQKDNFAKYALFTNTQTLPNGTTNVWFTDKTIFNGPVHTNGMFNFALNPSGTFNGLTEQHEPQARFYNSGAPITLNANQNGTEDVPTFNAGFNRGVDTITLDSAIAKQDMINQASYGATIAGSGIYVPNNGTNLTGGIYVDGNANITLSVDAGGNAVYTISQGGTTKTVTVNTLLNQTTVNDPGAGTTDIYSGLPKGQKGFGTIIYVDGTVTGFSGTVQANTEITVASTDNLIISDHIVYESYTPGVGTPGTPGYVPPNANGASNILGIVSWEGDVLIGTSASDDVNVHGSILAQSGILQVDDYNDQGVGPRGTATILGGVISDNYGAFGLFNGSTGQQTAGYGRNFVYDGRMLTGNSPPYYPTLKTYIAFSPDLTDKLIWQEGQ